MPHCVSGSGSGISTVIKATSSAHLCLLSGTDRVVRSNVLILRLDDAPANVDALGDLLANGSAAFVRTNSRSLEAQGGRGIDAGGAPSGYGHSDEGDRAEEARHERICDGVERIHTEQEPFDRLRGRRSQKCTDRQSYDNWPDASSHNEPYDLGRPRTERYSDAHFMRALAHAVVNHSIHADASEEQGKQTQPERHGCGRSR